MTTAEALYRLQSLDLRVESLHQALHADGQQLGESQELRDGREAVSTARQALRDAEVRQRDLELELAQAEGKLREVENKLYAGNVRNPKELGNWERDAVHLRERKGHVEDTLLTVMDEVEARQRALRSAEEVLRQTEAAWQAAQAELQQRIAEQRAEVAATERERDSLASRIDEASRNVYERLRRDRGGRAVARVEQSTCQGCRLSMPAAIVHRARLGPDLVFCGSCGRILWAAR